MSLIRLENVGKIYVSEGNIAVGIRGIDLSFDRGEFVAITGKSGSGKSTLLNVISGMDTYEEGELYIEGEPTSHYRQSDWERYRSKYVSFIFQDYNVIDSFTVLENVELALMHIENAIERRKRAIDLLTRVGMEKFLRQRGSKLSGGQKQRTVIARALAKDSPIILADEPTGNLDSETAKEIVELLHEVSRDKLLIVVTHNFEQVENYATRQIRIYDGGVEFDHDNIPAIAAKSEAPSAEKEAKVEKIKKPSRLKNALTLGGALYKAMPKLSVFMSLMMILGALGIFLAATVFGSAWEIFSPKYVFRRYEGRLVVAQQDGSIPTSEELFDFVGGAKTVNATGVLRYDFLLDDEVEIVFDNDELLKTRNQISEYLLSTLVTFNEDFGRNIVGRYPEKDDEAFLYLPVWAKPAFGERAGRDIVVPYYYAPSKPLGVTLKVVGIKYYYDNHLTPKMLVTKECFEMLSCAKALVNYSFRIESKLSFGVDINGENRYISVDAIIPYFSSEKKIYKKSLSVALKEDYYPLSQGEQDTFTVSRTYNGERVMNSVTIPAEYFDEATEFEPIFEYSGSVGVLVSTALIKEWMEPIFESAYGQASLFFRNDNEARNAVKALNDAGFLAVLSDATHAKDELEALLQTVLFFYLGAVMIGLIIFFAFFVNLVTRRSLDAFKSDVAIMRSMGISAGDIRLGSYFRVFLTLLPSIPFIVLVAIFVFTNPILNAVFSYLYWWQYALIFLGLTMLAFFVTRMQMRRLFKESVKKAIKGGDAA